MDDPQRDDRDDDESVIDDEALTTVIGGRPKGLGVALMKMWLNQSGKSRLTPSDTTPLL